jgi:hypothetical protein
MKPLTFSKVEDPLEAEAWIKAIEAKFSAFVMPCSKENKANFAALQLRGEALMWLSYGPPWAHYLSGYQDRLLGGPLGLPGLRYTAPEGVEHKD